MGNKNKWKKRKNLQKVEQVRQVKERVVIISRWRHQTYKKRKEKTVAGKISCHIFFCAGLKIFLSVCLPIQSQWEFLHLPVFVSITLLQHRALFSNIKDLEKNEKRQLECAFCWSCLSFLSPTWEIRGSQWGGGFYGLYRLKFWLFYSYRLIFFQLRLRKINFFFFKKLNIN